MSWLNLLTNLTDHDVCGMTRSMNLPASATIKWTSEIALGCYRLNLHIQGTQQHYTVTVTSQSSLWQASALVVPRSAPVLFPPSTRFSINTCVKALWVAQLADRAPRRQRGRSSLSQRLWAAAAGGASPNSRRSTETSVWSSPGASQTPSRPMPQPLSCRG